MGQRIRSLINKLRGNMDVPSLVNKGLTIGEDVFINFGCVIDESFCWLVKIGSHVTLAPNVHILAHDASTKKELGFTKIRKVNIGSYVFVGAGSIILPGCTIGDKVIIGAGSIVTKDIPENSVAVGNPAHVICTYDDYVAKQSKAMENYMAFENAPPTESEKRKIKKYLESNRIAFIR